MAKEKINKYVGPFGAAGVISDSSYWICAVYRDPENEQFAVEINPNVAHMLMKESEAEREAAMQGLLNAIGRSFQTIFKFSLEELKAEVRKADEAARTEPKEA